MEKTIFEKILDGSLSCKKIYESDSALSFFDINPIAPVHAICIPKKKIQSLDEIDLFSDSLTKNFLLGIRETAKILQLEKGYRVVFNVGDFGGQTVLYLHAHILGGKRLDWKNL